MRRVLRRSRLVVLALTGFYTGCAPSLQAEVLSGGETVLSVEVDLAESEEARRRGLRDYSALSPEQGVVLVFPGVSEVCITNRGVAFAIDAVFVEAGRVSAVESFGVDEDVLRCHRADEVLEVVAGVASRVRVGDEFRRD